MNTIRELSANQKYDSAAVLPLREIAPSLSFCICRLEAAVFVEPDFEKMSLGAVKNEILSRYYDAYNQMWILMPDSDFKLVQDNFVLMVYRNTRDEAHKQFAQCKSGNVVFQ